MSGGEDVGSGSGPGLEGHTAGLTPAPQTLPSRGLAGRRWAGRLYHAELDWLGQDRAVGPQSVVMQVASRASVYLLRGVR